MIRNALKFGRDSWAAHRIPGRSTSPGHDGPCAHFFSVNGAETPLCIFCGVHRPEPSTDSEAHASSRAGALAAKVSIVAETRRAVGAGAPGPITSEPAGKDSCPICFDGLAQTYGSVARMPCGHEVCAECFAAMFNHQKNQQHGIFCPSCRSPVENLVSEPSCAEKYASLTAEQHAYIEQHRQRSVPGFTPTGLCRSCHAVEHEGDCLTSLRAQGGIFTGAQAYWRLRMCPHCHVTIEKNGGCNGMKCRACGGFFNWKKATLHPRAAMVAQQLEPHRLLWKASAVALAAVALVVCAWVICWLLHLANSALYYTMKWAILGTLSSLIGYLGATWAVCAVVAMASNQDLFAPSHSANLVTGRQRVRPLAERCLRVALQQLPCSIATTPFRVVFSIYKARKGLCQAICIWGVLCWPLHYLLLLLEILTGLILQLAWTTLPWTISIGVLAHAASLMALLLQNGAQNSFPLRQVVQALARGLPS